MLLHLMFNMDHSFLSVTVTFLVSFPSDSSFQAFKRGVRVFSDLRIEVKVFFSERFLYFPKWQNIIIDSNSSNQWLSIILLIYNVLLSTPRFRKEAKTLKTQWWGVPWRGLVTSSLWKQKRKFFSKKKQKKTDSSLLKRNRKESYDQIYPFKFPLVHGSIV